MTVHPFALREERCASPARTSSSATNARRWMKLSRATSSGWSATQSFGIGDTLTTDPQHCLQRNPALHAGGLRLSAQSEHREVQAIPPGAGSTAAGRGHPGAVICAMPPAKMPLLAAVGPAAIRGRAIPARKRIRRGSRLESAPWTVVRWLPRGIKEERTRRALAADRLRRSPMIIARTRWCCFPTDGRRITSRKPTPRLPCRVCRSRIHKLSQEPNQPKPLRGASLNLKTALLNRQISGTSEKRAS